MLIWIKEIEHYGKEAVVGRESINKLLTFCEFDLYVVSRQCNVSDWLTFAITFLILGIQGKIHSFGINKSAYIGYVCMNAHLHCLPAQRLNVTTVWWMQEDNVCLCTVCIFMVRLIICNFIKTNNVRLWRVCTMYIIV